MRDLVRALTLGGIDGVVTSFAIVVGASLLDGSADEAVRVVGFASLLADGTSMGVAEYVSSRTEEEVVVATSSSSSSASTISKREGSPSGSKALAKGIACFASFVALGSAPLLLFLSAGREPTLAASAGALVELMLLGICQSVLASQPVVRGLLRTSLLGTAAGLVAYGAGVVAREVRSGSDGDR